MPPFFRLLCLGVVVLVCSAPPWPARAQDGRGTLCGAHSRCLVIDAQDVGMAATIDGASFEALDRGALTSAGMLVPAPWFPEVVRWSRAHPNFAFGIQLDLNAALGHLGDHEPAQACSLAPVP